MRGPLSRRNPFGPLRGCGPQPQGSWFKHVVMYLLILLLPLLGFLFTIGLGRFIGLGAFIISTGSVGLTLILTILAFYEVVYNNSTVYVDIGYWINLTHLQIGWSFIFDSITVSMLFIITLISFLVHFYSIYYMYTDKHYPRFMAYLSLFTFFMILLVTSNNLLLMFFGWEGSLYCLKWYDSITPGDAPTHTLCGGAVFNNLLIPLPFLVSSGSHFKFIRRAFHHPSDGSQKIRSTQRIGPHGVDVLSLIVGSLLGDSHLEKRKNGVGSRLLLEQCNSNVEYLMWFHKFLATQGYCSLTPPKLHKRIKEGKIFFHYRINSYTFSSFNWIHDMFYKWDPTQNRYIKVVPSNLGELLTPLSLAIWFMDDGSRAGKAVRIATNGFTLEEIKFLCHLLYEKFNLVATPSKAGKDKGHILYIHKKSMITFVNLIKPYMIKSLHYKLGDYLD
jgi:heme/copper-type cytochrome/quinol oxidase subunit 4